MRFRLFGPVEVRVDGVAVPVGGRRQRAVLAALLLTPGEVVSTEQLVHRVWDRPPGSAESNVRTYIARLRRVLGERLSTHDNGYRITVAEGELDAGVFAALVERAESASGPAEAARLYAEALTHARDEPLLGVELEAALRSQALRLRERRRLALLGELAARLASGEHHEVTGRLRALLTAEPGAERPTELLMLALFRSGRQIEALDAYAALRTHGVRPSPELTALHRRILNHDQALLAERPAVNAHHGLPTPPPEFTGRTGLAAAARDLIAAAPPHAPAILVFSGMPGAGKTALAVHIGHLLAADGAGRDGHLHADLNGFTSGTAPADPHAVLGALLTALGLPEGDIPGDTTARSALYREHTAGRRLLILLDNAAGAAQVVPLIPAGLGTVVLVTSRRELLLDGAGNLTVEPLTESEALGLLARLLGAQTVESAPEAALTIARRCGNLPLALTLAAGGRSGRDLAVLAARLDREPLPGELSRAFSVSCAALAPGPRRLFRLLGSAHCEDVTAQTAAALCGRPPEEVDGDLEALLDDHLLTQTQPGRYRVHRLLRRYAASLAEETAGERDEAVTRLYDWYLRRARRFAAEAAPAPTASAWFDAEHPNILALVRAAVREGKDARALAELARTEDEPAAREPADPARVRTAQRLTEGCGAHHTVAEARRAQGGRDTAEGELAR
ncbi:BTAD domain-containing putative transcriptional regulator [Phytomonospora sp. NPDC050363]|uniref:AfsR/SARP family transcriptional regulator n=1 Tax=Phytomonospora sp. NPDC050363 TaxID=3155642 RepID=UPI0033FCE46D